MSSRPNRISEERAATLLGLEAADLRRLSRETGLGEAVPDGGSDQLIFTYAELYRLCRITAQLTAQ
jgi:hypothetical protein